MLGCASIPLTVRLSPTQSFIVFLDTRLFQLCELEDGVLEKYIGLTHIGYTAFSIVTISLDSPGLTWVERELARRS